MHCATVPVKPGSPPAVLAAPQQPGKAKMWIDESYRAALQNAGLDTFAAMMATTDGRCMRALPDRENWRLELHAPHAGPRGAFLKKHHERRWSYWLRAKLGLSPLTSPGRTEADNVARLEQVGLGAMRLIAYGERLDASGLLESFVLTEELTGYTQLDHFLRRRFADLNSRPHAAQPRDRRFDRLLSQVADVARRFHAQGYNHRDLYCCHFFIQEHEPAAFRVRLIDLQRVEHRARWRRRWIVKDLAQLAYSAPREQVSCSRRMAWIKAYLGVEKLRPRDKRLIRSILRKQWLMEYKLGPCV